MSNRDNFVEKTKKILQERVGNRCSNPICRCTTTGPNTEDTKATRIGVAAHITAAAPKGPRYDPELSMEDRKSILNGIWLCQNCATMIDSDEKRFPVELIQRWKAHSEELARMEMEGVPIPPEMLHEGYHCPHCDTFAKAGTKVCLGCRSLIYYGSLPHEWRQEFQLGIGYFILAAAFLLFFIPMMLNQNFGTDLPIAWGIGSFWVIALLGLGSPTSGYLWAKRNDDKRRLQPPRFLLR